MALQQAHHRDLASDRASAHHADPLALDNVYVAGLAADVGLIGFNVAAELAARLIVLMRQPNPVQEKPRGLLRDAERPMKAMCVKYIIALSY